MEALTSKYRANRWQNKDSLTPVLPHSRAQSLPSQPPANPPDESDLSWYLIVQLSCTWISAPYCALYRTEFWHLLPVSWTTELGGVLLGGQPHFWSGPLSVLSSPTKRLPGVPHRSCSLLLHPHGDVLFLLTYYPASVTTQALLRSGAC